MNAVASKTSVNTTTNAGEPSDAVVPFADGMWLSTDPVRFLGLRLTATMTVLRLRDGGLLLYSPVRLTPPRRAAIESLGTVRHLYVPNLFHHSWIDPWIEAFPSARLHGPRGLPKKHRGLRVDRAHGAEPEPDFAGLVDELAIDGFRLRETALFYRPARALVVADLVHNVGHPAHGWTSMYAGMMGFRGRVALSRTLRWTAFDDRRAARRSLDVMLALPIERAVVGHGAPLGSGARDAVASAYAWLRG